MDSFLQKFSLQNLLRQFFCGVVFFVPLWLFARTQMMSILGVENGNAEVYLIFSALAYIVGTTIYHLEKNLHSYPLQLVYEYYYQGTGIMKRIGTLLLTFAPLVSLCAVVYFNKPFLPMSMVLGCYLILASSVLRTGKKRLIDPTLNQWLWEEKARQFKKKGTSLEDALPLHSENDLQKVATMKKVSTWSDFIHCVQSCCFAWILGCVVIKLFSDMPVIHGNTMTLTCICAVALLLLEGLIDAHRYRFVRCVLQNALPRIIDSQIFIALTSEKGKKSPDESIFTQKDKCDSPENEENETVGAENILQVFENKIAPLKTNMMTTERLCELLETTYKSGKATANKKIVFGILSYVKNCLGDDVLLRLLQKMEKYGDSIAWAVEVTNKSPHEREEIRVPNGNPQQARYYKNCLLVCDKSYLVSAQWYSCKGDNEQTIKALLDMVVELSIEELHSHIKKQ